jgi:hypothetical protein
MDHPFFSASQSTAFKRSFAGITELVSLHKRRLEPSVRRIKFLGTTDFSGHASQKNQDGDGEIETTGRDLMGLNECSMI